MKLQCGNTYCTRVFTNKNDLKLHNIVVHKARLRKESIQPSPSCNQTKKQYYLEKIKNVFTSETRKLDEKSPPTKNIYLDPFMCKVSSCDQNKGPRTSPSSSSSGSSEGIALDTDDYSTKYPSKIKSI
jgi:hypothetical protein